MDHSSYIGLKRRLQRFADEMIEAPTRSELALKLALDSLMPRRWNTSYQGALIRFQAPVGYYIADFYCPRAKWIWEVDGSWHEQASARLHDRIRDDRLFMERQIFVTRIPDREVLENPKKVARGMLDWLFHWRESIEQSFNEEWYRETYAGLH